MASSRRADDLYCLRHTNNYRHCGRIMNTLALILGGIAAMMVIVGFTMMTLGDLSKHVCDVCGQRFATDRGMKIHRTRKHD